MDIRRGWVNLDSLKIVGVNVIHNLESNLLPFKDNCFEYVLCQDILEHVNIIKVLLEIYRVLQIGGICEIRVPHHTSRGAYTDPTHIKYFSVDTFDFFIKTHPRNYYFNFGFTDIIEKKIIFEKNKIYIYNYFIEIIINIKHATQVFYESSFLKGIFPALNIVLKLIK